MSRKLYLIALATILLSGLFVTQFSTLLAQIAVDFTIFTEDDNLIIYVPREGNPEYVSLDGLAVQAINQDERLFFLADFIHRNIDDPIPTPFCLQLSVRRGTLTLPLPCQGIEILYTEVPDTFWYNRNLNQSNDFAIFNSSAGITSRSWCRASQLNCNIRFILSPNIHPANVSPTGTTTPTGTFTPTRTFRPTGTGSPPLTPSDLPLVTSSAVPIEHIPDDLEVRLLAPESAQMDDFILVRLELVPDGEDIATAVPMSLPSNAPMPSTVETRTMAYYPIIGAEIVGSDLENFQVESLLYESVLHLRPDAVNFWEWYLSPIDSNALGSQNLGVRIYVPEQGTDGSINKRVLQRLNFSITIMGNDTITATPNESEGAVRAFADFAEAYFKPINPEDADFTLVYGDRDSFFVVANQSIPTDRIVLRSSINEVWLADIDGLDLLNYELGSGWCIRYLQYLQLSPLIEACSGSETLTQVMLTVDVFWTNVNDGTPLSILVADLATDRYIGICTGTHLRCHIQLPD